MSTIAVEDLRLVTIMSGDNFDGLMNFGVVILEKEGLKIPLDILGSMRFTHKDAYHVICDFEPRLKHMRETFEDLGCFDFDFITDVLSYKGLDEVRGETNYLLQDDLVASQENINRIQEAYLMSVTDKDIKIPVIHTTKY